MIINPYAFGGGGGVVVTWSPTVKHADIALSGGDLIATKSAAGSDWRAFHATAAHSNGIRQYRVTISGTSAFVIVGLAPSGDPLGQFVGVSAGSWGYYSVTGQKANNNVLSAYGATYASGDVIDVIYDAGAGTMECRKNGTSQGTMAGLSGALFPAASIYEGSSTMVVTGGFNAASMTLYSGASAWGI